MFYQNLENIAVTETKIVRLFVIIGTNARKDLLIS